MTRIGSLFSGTGALDLAAEQVTGGTTAWHVENNPDAAKVLAHHWPGTPNHGSITEVDWRTVEPVDVLVGGFPCTDVSSAGKRLGMREGTRSGLWSQYARAIDALNPHAVIIENVRGLLTAKTDRPGTTAINVVLDDLGELGYETHWQQVTAASVGAPHRRARIFMVAQPVGTMRAAAPVADLPPDAVLKLLPTPVVTDAKGARNSTASRPPGSTWSPGDVLGDVAWRGNWDEYEPAVRRWEWITRLAPVPVVPKHRGEGWRLNPCFSEWMMGWPRDWVTAPEIELSRAAQLRLIGNGVVTRQAVAALAGLVNVGEVAA